MSPSRRRFTGGRQADGFMSGLETALSRQLKLAKVDFLYEPGKVKYLKPERWTHYTPDFILPNGILIEAKGEFTSEDRQKHKILKPQHPDLDVRFVFSNAHTRIGKKSDTTYAMWATRYEFYWAHRTIPQQWLEEAPNLKSIAALKALGFSHPAWIDE